MMPARPPIGMAITPNARFVTVEEMSCMMLRAEMKLSGIARRRPADVATSARNTVSMMRSRDTHVVSETLGDSWYRSLTPVTSINSVVVAS